MSYWGVETTDRSVVVAAYTNTPMNYFVGEGVEELAALLPTWRAPEVRAVVIMRSPSAVRTMFMPSP